jgi:hypothetical protein
MVGTKEPSVVAPHGLARKGNFAAFEVNANGLALCGLLSIMKFEFGCLFITKHHEGGVK